MIVISKHFFYKNYVGLTLWPFIILKYSTLKKDAILIHHERIHLKQQQELLLLPFYFFYMFEWLLRCVRYLDSYKAYQNISFEREAYANEANLNYASERKPFSFIKYL
jgi:hypothetical protein